MSTHGLKNPTDFSEVITDLTFPGPEISQVKDGGLKNTEGVYFNPDAKEGYQMAAAFLEKNLDTHDNMVSIYSIDVKDDTCYKRAGWRGKFVSTGMKEDAVKDVAIYYMIECIG